MSPRHTRNAAEALPPALVVLIAALEEQDKRDRPGQARALRAFAELALKQVPTRGVFAPNEGDLYKAIDQIAKVHLDWDTPRRKFFALTAQLTPFGTRDNIEAAANHMQSISDDAYFYAGLAFGITLVQFGHTR